MNNHLELKESEHVSLCEALDRVLNKGAVVVGEITISVADIDLIYLGLQLVLSSIGSIKGDDGSLFVQPSGFVGT